jgi:hypothetical protein
MLRYKDCGDLEEELKKMREAAEKAKKEIGF